MRGALFVINRIADEETESFLRRSLADQGIELMGVIHHDPDIGKAWLAGFVINGSNTHLDVEGIVQELEKAVAEFATAV